MKILRSGEEIPKRRLRSSTERPSQPGGEGGRVVVGAMSDVVARFVPITTRLAEVLGFTVVPLEVVAPSHIRPTFL